MQVFEGALISDFAGQSTPLGRDRVSFNVYGVSVSIRSNSEVVLDRFMRSFAIFSCPEAASPQLEITFLSKNGDLGDFRDREIYARFPAGFDLWEGSLLYFFYSYVPEEARKVRETIHLLDSGEPGYGLCRLDQVEVWGADWFDGLETLVFSFVMSTLPHPFALHAATLAKDGRALLLFGKSGSGKSSLSYALARRGFLFLGDEYAPLDPVSLEVRPFPRPLNFKPGSADLFPEMRQTPPADGTLPVRVLTPEEAGITLGREPARASFLIFLTHRAGATPELTRVPAQEAADRLEPSWGLITYRPPEARSLTRREVASALANGAECYDLVSGDLDLTVDLIEALYAATGTEWVGHPSGF